MPKVKLGHRLIGIAVELYRNDLRLDLAQDAEPLQRAPDFRATLAVLVGQSVAERAI